LPVINNYVFDIENSDCYEYVEKFRSTKRFLTSFRKDFNSIIAYHGTRIAVHEKLSIKNNGLRCANIEGMKRMAVDRFILPSDTTEIQEYILNTIDDFFITELPITIGEVNLVMDRELFKENYHYLLFGPESLLPLADRLKREKRIMTRKRMVDYGTSTIVKALVPAVISKDMWITGIYEYINNGFIDISLVIRESLPAENILDIEPVANPYDRQEFLYM
jgi:hypothetical protein